MSCTEARPLLDLLEVDALEASERGELDAHLAACGACGEEARLLARTYRRLVEDVEVELTPLSEALVARALEEADRRPSDAPGQVAKPAGPARVQLSCTYCHSRLERGGAVHCAGCLAPHHADCFLDHGRCSATGCRETRVLRGSGGDRGRRPGVRWLLPLGGGILAAAALAAAVRFGFAGGDMLDGRTSFGGTPPGATLEAAGPPRQASWSVRHGASGEVFFALQRDRPVTGPPVASRIYVVADDFVVDMWVNGVRVPDGAREVGEEVHGATSEVIRVDLWPDDWIVFNVVNNRLRWGGVQYFGVHAEAEDGRLAFTSSPDGWAACDAPAELTAFVASAAAGVARRATRIETPWQDAAYRWAHFGKRFTGAPIWGTSRNTYLKHRVRWAPSWVRPISARHGYPQSLGAGVDPYNQAHWPVTVGPLRRIVWTASRGGLLGIPHPSSDGQRVYIQAGGGGVCCFDARSGKLTWAGRNSDHTNYSSSILGSGEVSYGSSFHAMRSVDRDGGLRWETDLESQWFHAPPVLSPDESRLYVGGDAVGVAALDAGTGELLWIDRDFNGSGSVYCFDPQGRLIAATSQGLICYERDGERRWTLGHRPRALMVAGDDLLTAGPEGVLRIDLETRETRWALDVAATGMALASDGRVVLSGEGGTLTTLDPAGTVLAQRQLSSHALRSPITTADGILVTDAANVLYRCSTEGALLGSLQLGGTAGAWRPSVGPDGTVYVAGKDVLFCVETGGE